MCVCLYLKKVSYLFLANTCNIFKIIMNVLVSGIHLSLAIFLQYNVVSCNKCLINAWLLLWEKVFFFLVIIVKTLLNFFFSRKSDVFLQIIIIKFIFLQSFQWKLSLKSMWSLVLILIASFYLDKVCKKKEENAIFFKTFQSCDTHAHTHRCTQQIYMILLEMFR